MDVLLVANDQTIQVSGVTNQETGAFVNDATVNVSLKTPDGSYVSGQDWPLVLEYEVASDGNYSGLISRDVSLVHNTQYIIEISVAGGDGLAGFWRFARPAKYRTP